MSSTGDDDRGSDEIAVHDGSDIYAEDGSVRSDFLMHVGAAIADRDTIYLRQHVAGLHASELGDLIEAIQPEQRIALVLLLGKDFDLAALTEVDEGIRLDIVEHLPNEQIAEAIGEMDSDDAVYILEDLDEEDQEEILAKLPFTERVRLRRSLDYPESTAGRRMQTEFVAVPPSGPSARRSITCARTTTFPKASRRSSSSIRLSSCSGQSIWTGCCARSAR